MLVIVVQQPSQSFECLFATGGALVVDSLVKCFRPDAFVKDLKCCELRIIVVVNMSFLFFLPYHHATIFP